MRGLDSIERVGVVGAGTMGAGIAQVAATDGFEVVMRDVTAEYVEKGLDRVRGGLDRLVERDRLARGDADAALARIEGTTDLDGLADCDLAIEAVVEDLDVKREVFADLDRVVDRDVVLATNTSTLSVTTLGAATDRPALVVGLHFMNPVPVMDGVEVVVGERTASEAVALAHGFAERLGKETWEAEDRPGFVVNRVLMPWINEGIRAYDEGVAAAEDVDRGLRLGTNVAMGPLELADHVGLDVVLAASQTLQEALGDRHAPAYLLRRKVAAGKLGKKTGEGFYEYGTGNDERDEDD